MPATSEPIFTIHRRAYIWHQIPLFRLIWPFLGGIILGIFQPELRFGLYSLGLAMVFISLCIVYFKWGTAVLYIPAFLGLGYALTLVHTDRVFDAHLGSKLPGKETYYIAQITSDPLIRERSVKTEMKATAMVVDSDTTLVQGKLMAYFKPDARSTQLGYGDQIVFNARLDLISDPRNPNEFNYRRYMHFRQVTHQIYLTGERWLLSKTGTGWRREVFGWQHHVIETLSEFDINDRELAILSALLVGYKHQLSNEQVQAFASAGAMHVLAVSGLHVGIIFLILNGLFSFLDRFRSGKWMKGVLMILALWLYAALTGLSPSVTRAATMFTFVIIAKQFRRESNIYNTLATSAFTLLIVNPFLIVEVGFQLSYLAVLGIVMIQPYIYDLWKPRWWLLEKMWAITAVSIAAQLATFPLALLYFHQFPNYFLISNLVVIPAASIILPVGIAFIAVSWIPVLSNVFAWVLFQLVHWLDQFIQWVEQLPGALISGIDISIIETYLLYMIVASLCAFLIRKNYRWIPTFLTCLVLIEGLNAYEVFEQKHQRLLTVYAVKNANAIDFIEGRRHVFFADSSLVNDTEQMRFHVEHHWWSRDLQNPQDELESLSIQKAWIRFGKVTMLQVDSHYVVPSVLDEPVNILMICERTAQHPKVILKLIHPELIMLSTKLDWKSHNYWIDLAEDRGIPVHSLRNQGAYVLDLNGIDRASQHSIASK